MTLIKQIFIITVTFGLPAPQQVEKIILKKKKNFGDFILFMSSKYYNHWICEKPLGIKKQVLPYMQIASGKSQSVRIASHQPAFMVIYLVHEYVYYCLF